MRTDARRQLEDRGLSPPAGALAKVIPLFGAHLDRWVKQAVFADDADAVQQLAADVDRAGEATAARATGRAGGWLAVTAANLPPVAMIGWVVCRLLRGWWDGTYFESAFYLMAAALILASPIPGFLLLARLLSRRIAGIAPAALVGRIDRPDATAAVRDARAALARLVAHADRVRAAATAARAELADELAGGYGTVRTASPPSA